MPELPEVETIRSGLARTAAGARLLAVEGAKAQLRRPLDPSALGGHLVGRRLAAFRRRGKYLLLDTDPPGTLLVHLGMSGQLLLAERTRPLRPHTHLRLRLERGRELRFVDPRRFGLVAWLEPGEETRDPALARLGVDALSPTLGDHIPGLLATRRAPVKALLLDQRLVAGVGNIYATEALWRARIRPTRPGRAIARARLVRLAGTLQAVLADAIEAGGTTLRDFADADGNPGYFAVELAVYGRGGEPCPACSAALRTTVVAGRSTVWCPRCQR